MHTPIRILRAECDEIPGQRPEPDHREEEKRHRILDGAQRLMARHGSAAIRLTHFALAMRMAPQTLRRHFVDMDSVLAEILHRHLQTIVRAMAGVAPNDPNRDRARRAIYLAATRTAFGAPNEAHLLLIRERHLLPPDLLEPLEAHRLSIGDILAGAHAAAALALLDTPELDATDIETALAAITQPRKAPPARPPQNAAPRRPAPHHPLAPAEPPRPRPTDRPSRPDLNAAKRPPMGPH